jgi:hypothetical protein
MMAAAPIVAQAVSNDEGADWDDKVSCSEAIASGLRRFEKNSEHACRAQLR